MLYELTHNQGGAPALTPQDITMVVCVRAHTGNPWILPRLERMVAHYSPAPRIVLVDFGSPTPLAAELARVCAALAVQYIRSDDSGVFSLAAARNLGAEAADTALLFFSDIDCLGEERLFERLAEHANATMMGSVLDAVAVLPVYHLADPTTRAIETPSDVATRRMELSRRLVRAALSAPGEVVEYVDPHSNFFLIRRDYYRYVGGMNERFRGHGSEDFEFMVRVSLLNSQCPLPRDLLGDLGVRHRRTERGEQYEGFRALLELMAQGAELAGLRLAHLHHPRSGDGSGWYEHRDLRRTRLHAELAPLLEDRAHLLEYDWIRRPRRALALVDQPQHTDLLIALRWDGYAITRADGSAEGLALATRTIESGSVDAVAIFNPYMRSHVHFRPLVERARAKGLRVIVVERGALPDSWYFASDLAYVDPDYVEALPAFDTYSSEEQTFVERVLLCLARGDATLEPSEPHADTRARLQELRKGYKRTVFVPLQLSTDTAVTEFNAGFVSYLELERDLPTVAASHPETLFVVKPHPLSRTMTTLNAPNVCIVGRQDNVHALIDACDAVIAYNSGVGLLALLQGQRLITIGNAFYNRHGAGRRAADFAEAVEIACSTPLFEPDRDAMLALGAFLLLRKYAFMRGDSLIRELTASATHEYRNLKWYQLPFGSPRTVRRVALDGPTAAHSYAGIRVGAVERPETAAYGYQRGPRVRPARRTGTLRGKLTKLSRNPQRFLADSRIPLLRWIGRFAPSPKANTQRVKA